MLVTDEIAANSTEIDRAKEVFQIKIQNVSLPAMHACIGKDRVFLPKAMR